MDKWCYTINMHYEHINGAKINIERLSIAELENLKEHVLRKLDEVMEDHILVMEEIHRRSPQEWDDPLEQLDSEVQETVNPEHS